MFIVRAAVMYSDGEVLEGRDYGSITYLGNQLGHYSERIFGFVTNLGDFVDPNTAASIAAKSGQVARSVKELDPADLWPQPREEMYAD